MTLSAQGSLAGTTGSRCRIFYQDGSNWNEVPGIGSFDLAPSTRTATSYSAFEGTFSGVGTQEIGAATFEVASFVPGHRAWAFLDGKFNENDSVLLRVETTKSELYDSGTKTVAIANNTGICTFSDSTEQLTEMKSAGVARGHTILAGGTLYTIQKIDEDDVVSVSPPASAVTATTFEVILPVIRWVVGGKLSSSGGASITEDAATSSQFIVQPTVRVAQPTLHENHTNETA